jgi:L-ascorbate metabolism protein UlaG (beta-lactamase superfamily)
MKKWLKRAGIVFLLFVLVLLAAAFWSETDTAVLTRYVKNDALPTIKPGWPGNPVDQKDRFINDEFPYMPRMSALLKWTLDDNPFEEAKANDTARLEVKDPTEFLQSDRDGIMWLGHASFFIRLNGVSILLDPIFGKPPFVKEFVHVPSPLEKIRSVDFVLLSHDHRDHMDEDSLRSIAQKFPNARFLAGLRSEDVLTDWKTETNQVSTAGWFQQYDLADDRLKIYFLPVRHWSRRFLLDTNYRLWGGYVIQTDKTSIYFGGDSGYGRHYRETGELFPEIDYFLIGIGAFEPRWFMEPHHNSPSDAVKAFRDSGAKTLVPMHFGRFDLSDEPPSLPLDALMDEAEKVGIKEKVRVLTINEALPIE